MDDDKLEFYRDGAGEWRWRFIAGGNNEKMADSGEGYENRADCFSAAARVLGGEIDTLYKPRYVGDTAVYDQMVLVRGDEELAVVVRAT